MSDQLDLFPRNVGAALSPIARWKAEHSIETRFFPGRFEQPACWEAWIRGDLFTRYGENETDALFALAKAYSIPLWNDDLFPKPGSR